MVKIKERDYLLADGTIDISRWLHKVAEKKQGGSLKLIANACNLCHLAGGDHKTLSGQTCLEQGLEMAEILLDLHADPATIAAAILYGNVEYAELSLQDVNEQISHTVSKLISGAQQMESIRLFLRQSTPQHFDQNRTQIDNLRKMLLAMVEDVRVVLIKLAERTCLTRAASKLSPAIQQQIANESFNIYAPLANRLGIGQLKWELEDLCFRYLHTDTYKKLAKSLDSRRIDREEYVKDVIDLLEKQLRQDNLNDFELTGRAKHIYSIYRKMQRKNVDIDQIYDTTAVRVLVKTIEDCYAVLSTVHNLWEQIPGEFDDYISHPKSNGYRSLHTAVIGPEGKNLEVQIRTFAMHQESELGVAAHWKYKEGNKEQSEYEAKIAWLRQVIEWQKELAHGNEMDPSIESKKIFDDRVYVFTPRGEIVDLPKGATPLDFAYQVHSEIGHRCKGAKINGNIVPLAYELNTGEQIEILTGKLPSPSRDWIKIMKTARGRAKVHHYFKILDQKQHIEQGQSILDQEIKRLGSEYSDLSINYERIARKFHLKSASDLYLFLGCGDIKVNQVIHAIEEELKIIKPSVAPAALTAATIPVTVLKKEKTSPHDIKIQGVGDLLSFFAKCCKPIPGDPIIGFITRGRGVSIHRTDCSNIQNTLSPERVIEVSWTGDVQQAYTVDIQVTANERQYLMKDLLGVLATDKITLLSIKTSTKIHTNTTLVDLSVQISDQEDLMRLFKKLQQIKDVIKVERI